MHADTNISSNSQYQMIISANQYIACALDTTAVSDDAVLYFIIVQHISLLLYKSTDQIQLCPTHRNVCCVPSVAFSHAK